MKTLILTDGKAGHENQSKAFARALRAESEIRPVRFKGSFAKTLSYLLDNIGIRTQRLFSLDGPAPSRSDGFDAVVGTGSGTFYAAKTIARAIGAKCGVVLYPRGYDIASFDCILAPSFDRPPAAPNVLEIPANLVAADSAFYEDGVKSFREHHLRTTGREVDDAARAVAVIVGGPNKCSTLSPEWMREQLDAVFAANKPTDADPRPVRFWTTTSRRTPQEVEAVVDSFPWDYKLVYSRDQFNPIPAFVSLADALYVTAESTGMLSEACTSGSAEVHALDNLNPGPHKFRRFLDDLRENGYIDGRRKVDLSMQFAAARTLLAPDTQD